MTDDPKIRLTPDEAISVLIAGDAIHNYAQTGPMLIGIDYERDDAEKHIRDGVLREIGGPACQAMNHGLIVWSTPTRYTFFETDPVKLAAMEAAKKATD